MGKPKLKLAIRKIIGWTSITLSALFFISTILLFAQGQFGPSATGFLFSLGLFMLGTSVQENLDKTRERIDALFTMYFPRCPICKAENGYDIHGFLAYSQYVRCKNCGAQWYSPDFTKVSDLRSLRLSKPPVDPKIYAEYMSNSTIKPNKLYPTKVWQDLMNNVQTTTVAKNLSILSKIKGKNFNDIVLSKTNCFVVSLISAIALTFLGHLFALSVENSYILFIGTFFAVSCY